MAMSRDKKALLILAGVLLWLLCAVDLASPSLLLGIKRQIPRNVRGQLPWIEGLVIGGGVLYAVGTVVSKRLSSLKQEARFQQIGRKGRTFEVIVPRDSKALAGEMADLFARVYDETLPSGAQWRNGDCVPISWEWVARDGKIHCQVWVPEIEGRDVGRIIQTEVAAKYPASRVIPGKDMLAVLAGDDGNPPPQVAVCVEMQLSGPPHNPIKAVEEFKVDPLASVLQTIGSVEGEPNMKLVAAQIVAAAVPAQEWEPARAAAAAAIRAQAEAPGSGLIGAITGRQSPAAKPRALTAEERKKVAQLEDLRGQPAFRVVVRIVVAGADPQQCQQRARNIASKFGQYTSSDVTSPQSFEIAREYAFRPGREQPPATEPTEAGLSESKAATLRELRRMLVPQGPDSNDGGGDKTGAEIAAVLPEPVSEARAILYRMPYVPARFWPPWKPTRKSIILAVGLATLFHFPHKDLNVPGLVTRLARHIPPPREALISPLEPKPDGWLVLAAADDDQDPHWLVGLPYADLRRGGVYILGPAGSGKSVLLRLLGRQFLEERRGLSVIDPKEDLARALAMDVPLDQEGNVVWIHPAARGRPSVVNVLDRRFIRKIGADQVVAGTLAVFQKLIGANWEQAVNVRRILTQAIMALAGGEPDPSLLQLYAFLQDDTEDRPNEYRARVLQRVTDPMVTTFWLQQFPAIAKQYGQSLVSVMTRVESFLRNPMTRYLTGLRQSTINFRQIMDGEPDQPGGMIFLASVPDTLGDVQAFAGALLFNQLVAAGFSRYQDIPDEAERRDHAIIVDEFQTFAAEGSADMENLLAKLRGARVAVLLAHQSTAQINPKTMEIILANNQTRVIFALQSEQDARTVVGPWKAWLTGQDLMGLQTKRYEIYASCLVNNTSTGPFSARTILPPARPPDSLGEQPAEEFVWPEEDEYDQVVNDMALLEAEMMRAARDGDREREIFYLQLAVRELEKMSPGQYARYVARRQARDMAERDFILRNPAAIPDKMARIVRLSGLRFGKPRAEAEFEVARALAEVIGQPVPAAASEEGGVEFSVEQIFAI